MLENWISQTLIKICKCKKLSVRHYVIEFWSFPDVRIFSTFFCGLSCLFKGKTFFTGIIRKCWMSVYLEVSINSIKNIKENEKIVFMQVFLHSVFKARGDDKAESWKSICVQYLHVGCHRRCKYFHSNSSDLNDPVNESRAVEG